MKVLLYYSILYLVATGVAWAGGFTLGRAALFGALITGGIWLEGRRVCLMSHP
jgi:hypothetical protein